MSLSGRSQCSGLRRKSVFPMWQSQSNAGRRAFQFRGAATRRSISGRALPHTRWTALCRFLDDGRIDLDNNPVERAIRPIALGRKNHLFAGSDGGGARWATVSSLIATAKLNDVEPFAYLRDILERMTDGHPMSRIDDLLPWNWPKIPVNH